MQATNITTKQTSQEMQAKIITLSGMQQEASGVPYFNAKQVDIHGNVIKTFKINPETMLPFSSNQAKEADIVVRVDYTSIGGHSWLFTKALPKPQVKSCGLARCTICSNTDAFQVIL